MNKVLLIGRGPWGERCKETLRDLGAEVTQVGREFSEVMKRGALDYTHAVVACRASLHAEVARSCIIQGLPTFIEKPMATSSADARLLVNMAADRRVQVVVDHIDMANLRFLKFAEHCASRAYIEYRDRRIKGGWRPFHLEIVLSSPAARRADIVPLWDWGPHALAMSYACFDELPASVIGKPRPGGYLLSLQFSRGSADVFITQAQFVPKSRQASLVGCCSITPKDFHHYDGVANLPSEPRPLANILGRFLAGDSPYPFTGISWGYQTVRDLESTGIIPTP